MIISKVSRVSKVPKHWDMIFFFFLLFVFRVLDLTAVSGTFQLIINCFRPMIGRLLLMIGRLLPITGWSVASNQWLVSCFQPSVMVYSQPHENLFYSSSSVLLAAGHESPTSSLPSLLLWRRVKWGGEVPGSCNSLFFWKILSGELKLGQFTKQ